MNHRLTPAQAAELLEIGEERVRQLCRNGTLAASKVPGGREWQIDAAAVAERAGSIPPSRRRRPAASTEVSVDEIVEAVIRRLCQPPDTSAVAEVRRERDRYRSDAAAVREAALHLTQAAREVRVGMAAALAALDEQAEALSALLAPGSVADLLPPP